MGNAKREGAKPTLKIISPSPNQISEVFSDASFGEGTKGVRFNGVTNGAE